jgi:hypothetical protein
VIDVSPDTLTLKMLLRAGAGDDGGVRVLRITDDLASTLLVLYVSMVRSQLADFARSQGAGDALPVDRGTLLRRVAITGPAMLRWTWSVLEYHLGERGLTGLRERQDDYYIPLTAEPKRTLCAFAIRDELAARFGVPAETDPYTEAGSFLTLPRVGKALMPLGLHSHEVEAVAAGAKDLGTLARVLRSPQGELDRAVVGRDGRGNLRAFSLETNAEITL